MWSLLHTVFIVKYLNEHLSYETTEGMQSILKVLKFSNIFIKRALGIYNAPKNHKRNFWQKFRGVFEQKLALVGHLVLFLDAQRKPAPRVAA